MIVIQSLTAFLLVSGSFFILVATLGTLRFSDILTRMHAATKASSFGVTQMLIALALAFPDGWVVLQSLLVILFIFLTNPVSAHLIARACYVFGVERPASLQIDELRENYDLDKGYLHSGMPENGDGIQREDK